MDENLLVDWDSCTLVLDVPAFSHFCTSHGFPLQAWICCDTGPALVPTYPQPLRHSKFAVLGAFLFFSGSYSLLSSGLFVLRWDFRVSTSMSSEEPLSSFSLSSWVSLCLFSCHKFMIWPACSLPTSSVWIRKFRKRTKNLLRRSWYWGVKKRRSSCSGGGTFVSRLSGLGQQSLLIEFLSGF